MQFSAFAVSPPLTQWWPGGGGADETPELLPGLSEADISPGIAGFLFTALMAGLAILVVRDMVKRMRRMKYHSQVEAEINGEEPEFPGEITAADISQSQQRARSAAAEARFGPASDAQSSPEDQVQDSAEDYPEPVAESTNPRT